jgi:hypothetical protein
LRTWLGGADLDPERPARRDAHRHASVARPRDDAVGRHSRTEGRFDVVVTWWAREVDANREFVISIDDHLFGS